MDSSNKHLVKVTHHIAFESAQRFLQISTEWICIVFSLPDLERKLYLSSLEMNGELPDVMTQDSLSEW